MRIERLRLRSFRNYEQADVRPAPGVTVLYGENAQGKTNLMEAVHLCCVGRSHRTSRDRELVRWGESEAYVQADVRRLDGPRQIGVALFPSETKKKKITINGEPVKRIGELMGQVNAVLFSPEDLRLVKDGPDGRRRFLDMEISQLQPAYFYALQRYARALNQRNGLLRELQGRSDGALASTIEEWDALLAQTGAAVLARRKAYLARLDEKAREIHRDLSGGRETLTLRDAGCDGDEQGLLMLLRAARGEDCRRGFTSVGPHRDDYKIIINGRDARAFASQGQQRTAALSLKLAEIEVMRDETREAPILLLDDVMSELDVSRRRMLLSRIGDVQTLITCTHLDDLGGAKYDKAISIHEGTLTDSVDKILQN